MVYLVIYLCESYIMSFLKKKKKSYTLSLTAKIHECPPNVLQKCHGEGGGGSLISLFESSVEVK